MGTAIGQTVRGICRLAAVLGVLAVGPAGAEGEGPRVLRHVVVDREPGRFAGWPANHGI